MKNKSLISLAVLKTNADKGIDIYDNFSPMVVECIRRMGQEVVSVPAIQAELASAFGLDLPQHVITTIITRLRNRGLLELDKKAQVVRPTPKAVDTQEFAQARQVVLEKLELVLDDMVDFVKARFSMDWTEEKAEESLLCFLDTFQQELSQNFYQKKIIPMPASASAADRYLAGSYINHVYETYSSKREVIETLTKGFMLANALYLPNPSQIHRKFRQTRVFFDTTFLIYALGYAGETRKVPCIELLDMLAQMGAELRCFKHTLDEMRAVLENTSEVIHYKRIDRASKAALPSIDHFIAVDASYSDILFYAGRLEKDLTDLHITVEDAGKTGGSQAGIDEVQFRTYLHEKVPYRKGNGHALHRDVLSIMAVLRLRNGGASPVLEDTQAVFVTSNSALARVTAEFFASESKLRGMMPCITDRVLANLVWLKMPIKRPELPVKIVLADCLAAMQPSEELIRAYLAEIDRLKERKEISEEDVFTLRYNASAKAVLMEKTLGEEGVFVEWTIKEILAHTKRLYTEQTEKELALAKQKIEASRQAEMARRQALERRALQLARGVGRVTKAIIFLVVLGCNLYLDFDSGKGQPVPAGVLLAWLLLTSMMVFDLWKEYVVEMQLRKIERWLADQFVRGFLKITSLGMDGDRPTK